METGFINADLDLVSRDDLTELSSAMDRVGLFPLAESRRGRSSYATFELTRRYRSPEHCVRLVLDAVEKLSPRARAMFKRCTTRVIDLGFNCGDTWAFRSTISARTLSRLTALGIDFALTLYPVDREPPKRVSKLRAPPSAPAGARRRRAAPR